MKVVVKIQLLIPALLLVFLCQGQSTVTQSGSVIDSLSTAVASATIVARGYDHDDFKYASSNLEGAYKIDLKLGLRYLLSVRSIGYVTLVDTVSWNKNTTVNYRLERSKESLDSILIKARAPLLQKGDTTAYRVEYFLTGDERKARDVLEKLPGVEVDARGNVQVNGKDVTTLMVDGKTFFSGDEKLGVNNIPADVIDEIEIIQNYDPIPFMKQLKETEQIALNIKLKDDKRNFIFGDAGVGLGYEDTYSVNANLFYYSKKLGVNVVSGASNDGKRVFSAQDYMDFEGGASLLLNDSEKYFQLLNSGISNYLNREDFEENTNVVGAANIVSEISPRSTLTAYSVWLNDASSFKTITNRFYPIQNTQERLDSRDNVTALLGLTKIKWQYRKTVKNYWDFSALFRNSISESTLSLISESDDLPNRFTNKDADLENYNFDFTTSHHAQWGENSFIEWETTFSNNQNANNSIWNFNQPVFSDLIDYEGAADNIFLRQNRSNNNLSIISDFDYYWSYGRYSQLNPKLLVEHVKENYETIDGEVFNNIFRSFQEDNFNNDLDFNSITLGLGLDHFVKKKNQSLRIGFMLNRYRYSSDNFRETSKTNNILRFLPKLEYKISFLKNRKFDFNYYTKVLLPNSNVLADRFRLAGYNSVVQGNSNIEHQYLHQSRVTYSSGSRTVKHLFFSSINYSYRNQSVTSSREFLGIDQVSRYILLKQPNQNFGFSLSSTTLRDNWRFVVKPSYQLSLSNDIINQDLVKLQINRLKYDLRAISSYNNFVNFKLGFNQSFTQYDGFNDNSFINSVVNLEISHDFNNAWIINSNYNQTYFENVTTGQRRNYGVANFNLNHRPLKSNWSFDLNAYNIFNAESRLDATFSDFIVNDVETFVLPFRIIFKTSYNF